jgi:hypothetical protein
MDQSSLYALTAEFYDGEELLEAVREARAAGYTDIKAYSPYEVHGLSEELVERSNFLGWLVLAALILGVVGAFALQYWTSVTHYPLNVGGRPLNSWPAFLLIMFEAAILFGGLATAGFMFVRNGFPQPYDPIFNATNFGSASRNRFFMAIEQSDNKFNLGDTWQFLQSLEPIKVSEVRC